MRITRLISDARMTRLISDARMIDGSIQSSVELRPFWIQQKLIILLWVNVAS
jgi:hypothetical protein